MRGEFSLRRKRGQSMMAYVYLRLKRRLTKGQQAMHLAMAYDDVYRAPGRGRGKFKDITHLRRLISSGFSDERLRDARVILRYSRELADAVFVGQMSLDDALAARGNPSNRAECECVWPDHVNYGERCGASEYLYPMVWVDGDGKRCVMWVCAECESALTSTTVEQGSPQ